MVNQLAVVVTTRCNLACPACCYQMPTRALWPARHEPWAAFAAAARVFGDVQDLFVTGGEPTLHPEFPRIAREFRAMFDAERMVLVTNGARLIEHGDAADRFDEVRVSAYDDRGRRAADWLRARRPDLLRGGTAPEQVPLDHRGGPGRCDKDWTAVLIQGHLYPCCMGPGIPGSARAELTTAGRASLAGLPRPCARCIFGRPAAAPEAA